MPLYSRAREPVTPVPVAQSRSPLLWVTTLVFALMLALLLAARFPVTGLLGPSSVSTAIAQSSDRYSFDLVGWEFHAIAQGAARRVQASLTLASLGESDRRNLVTRYFSAVAEADRLRNELAAAYAPVPGERDEGRIADLQQHLAAVEHDQVPLSPLVTEIIAGQIGDYLFRTGISGPLIEPVWHQNLPLVRINPPVFFRFEQLPLLLVVAPRDRIKVLQSTFLQPDLSISQVEQVEAEIDRQRVTSIVLPIGGFAAYPSMIPADLSLRRCLQVVAHEWVHQYLAMHPLGQHYFSDYALRSINETVADLAGNEIGQAVFRQYYAESARSAPGLDDETPPSRPTASPSFDFSQAMADIRLAVEGMLSRGDVAGAERYMADRKAWLAEHGYYLRKLNTAYLTFYGAYAGAGNSYEPKLRSLRARSKSLADFLHQVETIASERDLDGLTGGGR